MTEEVAKAGRGKDSNAPSQGIYVDSAAFSHAVAVAVMTSNSGC